MYLLNILTHINKSKPVTTFQIKHTIIKYQVSTITREFWHCSNININISIIIIISSISNSTVPRRSSSVALQNSQIVLEKHYTNIYNGCRTRIYNLYTIQLHIFHKKIEAVQSTKTNSLIIFKCVQCKQASNQQQPKHANTPNLVLSMIKSVIQPQKISTINQLTTPTLSHHMQKTSSLQC